MRFFCELGVHTHTSVAGSLSFFSFFAFGIVFVFQFREKSKILLIDTEAPLSLKHHLSLFNKISALFIFILFV